MKERGEKVVVKRMTQKRGAKAQSADQREVELRG